MFTDGLNGLNWQVQVLPLSLSMRSLPPTLPVFAVPPLVAVDAEPQAATITIAIASVTNLTPRVRYPTSRRAPPGFNVIRVSIARASSSVVRPPRIVMAPGAGDQCPRSSKSWVVAPSRAADRPALKPI